MLARAARLVIEARKNAVVVQALNSPAGYPPKPPEPRLGHLVGYLGSGGPRRRTDQAAPGVFVGDARASPCGAPRGGENEAEAVTLFGAPHLTY